MTFTESGQRAAPAAWLSLVTAAALAIPIQLRAVGGYEPTLSFLLAPLIAWAVVISLKDSIARMFVAAGVCGLAAILISAWIKPDGRLHLDLLSLVLLMYTTAFYFLGRHVGDLRRFVIYFVVSSAVFLIPATLRNILFGEPVQKLNQDVFAILNVEWFGWPMFGNFGILGAAHMICLQAALAVGVALNARRAWLAIVGAVVFACATFLIVGSESRGSALSLLMVLSGAALYVGAVDRGLWRRASAMLVVAVVSMSFAQFESPKENRFVQTIWDVIAVLHHEEASTPAPVIVSFSDRPPLIIAEPPPSSLDAISSFRFSLQRVALSEFFASPILGSGFSPLGRYKPVSAAILHTTPHLYYLTVLWKGGLLFAVPFFAFLFMAALAVWRTGSWRRGPEDAMALIAVLALFGPMALTAETPNVPSAGALGFLLLGVLTRSRKIVDVKNS